MIGTLLSDCRAYIARQRLVACIRAEAAENFLELLLDCLRVGLAVNPYLRHSVRGFSARYRLATPDQAVDVALIFQDGHLKVEEDLSGPFDASLWFRDERALMRYFSSANPDLFTSLLHQDVVPEGNLNYIYRLAYLARHVQLEALGRV